AVNTGASVSRTSWPELWKFVQASGLLLTEAEWQAQAATQSSVGCFSSGDGATSFRLPRLRDYLRGADASNGRDVGAWQADAIRDITGSMTGALWGQGQNWSGALSRTFNSNDSLSGGTAGNNRAAFDFRASRVVPTADENRPKTINWLPCIQAASLPVDSGTVNMLELAGEVAGKINRNELPDVSSLPMFACRAWACINGAGIPVVRAGGNIAGVIDNGTGNYTVQFAMNMPDTDYSVVGSDNYGTANTVQQVIEVANKTVSGFDVYVYTGSIAFDSQNVALAIFR
ncbi:hypothetical protein V6C53_08105, partial [Desulfocurvibacter africanus]